MNRCGVSFTDSNGIPHDVEVQAESLYEAVALAVAELSRSPIVIRQVLAIGEDLKRGARSIKEIVEIERALRQWLLTTIKRLEQPTQSEMAWRHEKAA